MSQDRNSMSLHFRSSLMPFGKILHFITKWSYTLWLKLVLDGFIPDQQRTAAWGSMAMARQEQVLAQQEEENDLKREKGNWEVHSRVHGFSWAESLPGKERLSSSSWALLLSQGVGAPPSALLTWLNWVLYLLILYTQLQKMSPRLFLLSWSHSTFLESILELTHKSIRAWWLFLSCTRIF